MNESKPTIFIGSSSEGVRFAHAVRALLAQDAEVTVWDEGFFYIGGSLADILIANLWRFDFAVVVLTPDDLIISRGVQGFSPRDNTLFEVGLFMGQLGKDRTLIVRSSRDDLKLLSDWAGLTTAAYYWPRADDDCRAAVGAACDSIRDTIHRLGPIKTRSAPQIAVLHNDPRQPGGGMVPVPDSLVGLQETPVSELTHGEIAARAHEIWLRSGRPMGQDETIWYEAQGQLRAESHLRLCMQKGSQGGGQGTNQNPGQVAGGPESDLRISP